MTNPNARRARAGTRTALAAALLLAMAVPVGAEPMQLIDVFDGTDLSDGLASTVSTRDIGDDRLVTLVKTPPRVTGEGQQTNLLLLSRDPSTGGLTLLDRIERIGDFQDVGNRLLVGPGIAAHGDTVWVMGQAAPTTCGVAPCNRETVVLAYTVTDGGTLSYAYQVDLPIGIGDLIASPDGRFVYHAGSQTLYTLRVQEIGNLVQTGRTTYNDVDDTSDPHHHSITLTPDGRTMFVSLRSEPAIVVFRTDPETGAPAFVQRVDADADVPLANRATMAVSPDGATLFVASDTETGDDAGVLRFAIGTDGALAFEGVDTSANRTAPGTSEDPEAIALSPDGRQMFVHDGDRAVHKYTASEPAGTFTYRGFETNEEDGVPTRTIDSIALPDTESFAVSGDAGFVHYSNRVGGIATFDNRADLAVGFDDGAAAGADGDGATSRLTLFNAGPANAHGIEIDIVSRTDIVATSMPDACTVTGASARCTIDRLRANVPLELTVTAGLDAAGTNTLDATVEGIELDPDAADDAASTDVALAADGSGVTATTDGPGVPSGTPVPTGNGAAAGDDGGSGGCSIAGTTRSDPMLALLMALATGSLAMRRRSRRPVRHEATSAI